MTNVVRLFAAAAISAAGGVAVFAYPPAPPDDVMVIVIANGPHAGTYKPPTEEIICMDAKKQKQFAASYKDFDAKDPKAVSEGGINILNPDEPGPKQGHALVAFGDPGKKPQVQYSFSIFKDTTGQLTFTRSPKGADLSFQGKTPDGIAVRITAKCTDID